MTRFLSKDFLSGLLFIGFGLAALYFGRHLAMGTAVRMPVAPCKHPGRGSKAIERRSSNATTHPGECTLR